MNMTVEKSTVEQVRARLQAHKEKGGAKAADDYLPDGIDRRIAEREAEEERERQERKRAKKEAKRRAAGGGGSGGEEDEEGGGGGLDPDMAAMMGFSGFGGGKK